MCLLFYRKNIRTFWPAQYVVAIGVESTPIFCLYWGLGFCSLIMCLLILYIWRMSPKVPPFMSLTPKLLGIHFCNCQVVL